MDWPPLERVVLRRLGSVPLLLAAVAVALQGANQLLLAHLHVGRIGQQGEGFGLFLGFRALVDALQGPDQGLAQFLGVRAR